MYKGPPTFRNARKIAVEKGTAPSGFDGAMYPGADASSAIPVLKYEDRAMAASDALGSTPPSAAPQDTPFTLGKVG
jgi:hypothetical protein